MKRTENPNNNPWLAAAVWFIVALAAVLLFVAGAAYRQYGDGDTGGGNAFFGAGAGDGSGTGIGDGDGAGESDGGDGEAEGDSKKDGPDEGGKAEKSAENGNKNNTASGKSAQVSEGKAKKSPDSGKVNSPGKRAVKNFSIAEIFTGSEPVQEKKSEQDSEEVVTADDDGEGDDDKSTGAGVGGKRSFSSGGKSVFRVKKHDNVLFIVDVSGSMGVPTMEGLTRIQVLKHQLKRTIYAQNRIESRGRFAIIAFSDRLYFHPEKIRRRRNFASKKDCKEAAEWIDTMTAGGGTALNMAMTEAVELIKKRKLKVDAIYLLTDGDPTDIYDHDDFFKMLKKGLPSRIRIHTISIGQNSQLLKDIAKKFNGRYNKYD